MRSIYLIELVKYSGFYIILYSLSFIFQNELIIAEAKAQGAGVIATSIGKHIELPYSHTLQL